MKTSLPNPSAAEHPPRAARGRRWIWGLWLALPLLGLAAVLVFGPSFLLERIVQEAARRGVVLSGCSLELGFHTAFLRDCSFVTSTLPGEPSPFPGMGVKGRAPEIEIVIEGLSPRRVVVRRASVEASGLPLQRDALRSSASGWAPFPVEVEAGTVTWHLREDEGSTVLLTDVAYVSDAEDLRASWEWPGRARGQLAWRAGTLELTASESASFARLVVRPVPTGQRLEVSLELREFPLAKLEGSALRFTDTLRAISVDGRVFLTLPTGLDMALPAGDFYLTLTGLQFPVPREVDGLVHGSPPRVSGKLSLSRSFDRVSIRELGFITGQLQMSGRAELALDPQLRGLRFEAHMNGPLSCRAIAESAAIARAGSTLGKLAGRFAKSVLSGNVQVVAALSGETWQLEQASVLTSIGVGCGLQPLPIDVRAAADMLSRLPAEVLQKLPRARDLPKLPELGAAPSWRRPHTPASPVAPRSDEAP